MTTQYYATGKRKTSVARVWLVPGDGTIVVNKKGLADYFNRETSRMIIRQPFDVTGTWGNFNVKATVSGGGLSGQAGALRQGIAKALLATDPTHRPALKRAGLIRRDPRVKERKKYGQRGARARFQFSKR